MQNHQPEPDPETSAQSESDLKSLAQTSGASKEQIAQLVRSADAETDLDDAAAAAARWS